MDHDLCSQINIILIFQPIPQTSKQTYHIESSIAQVLPTWLKTNSSISQIESCIATDQSKNNAQVSPLKGIRSTELSIVDNVIGCQHFPHLCQLLALLFDLSALCFDLSALCFDLSALYFELFTLSLDQIQNVPALIVEEFHAVFNFLEALC